MLCKPKQKRPNNLELHNMEMIVGVYSHHPSHLPQKEEGKNRKKTMVLAWMTICVKAP
jgi:hypothetical protein